MREGARATTDAARGKLRLVAFADPQPLAQGRREHLHARRTACSRKPPTADVRVIQGAIEKSNVRAVVEMTRMIELTRAYTEVANILQQQGDMRRNAIEQLAEVRPKRSEEIPSCEHSTPPRPE